jgi:MFS family permease
MVAGEASTPGAPAIHAHAVTPMPTVIIASALGTTFEWYDFFVFGTLAPVIAKNFFTALDPTAGLLAALGLFGAGFFFRPIGALIFGRVGDRVGRKGAFLITVTMMGAATVGIGLLPTYVQAGPLAPLLLILMRIVQGTALGGQYGGAVIYVAEHARSDRRGFATSWVQAAAAPGLVAALTVVLITRASLGEARFQAADWLAGWRLPFLLSAGLLVISIWMRLKLSESPGFLAMKEADNHAKAPYAEAFGQWSNLKLVLIALLCLMSAQGAVWYTTFFYAEQVFLERFMKIDPLTGTALLTAVTAASAPLYVLFATLSDKVGRKWVMWFGMTLALVAFFPAFHSLARLANPALVDAQRRTPVVVVADPARCSFQFDITGKARFATSCDIAKSLLANAGISYANRAAGRGALAEVRIGQASVPSVEAGYPAKADPAHVNFAGLFGVMMIFAVAATALFGPIATALVELFPMRIRYTAMSLPYHVGTGWVGGFVPVTAFAIVTATGNIYAGLWYPVVFTAISVLTLPFLFPEVRGRPI